MAVFMIVAGFFLVLVSFIFGVNDLTVCVRCTPEELAQCKGRLLRGVLLILVPTAILLIPLMTLL